jgi:hypothetical protein
MKKINKKPQIKNTIKIKSIICINKIKKLIKTNTFFCPLPVHRGAALLYCQSEERRATGGGRRVLTNRFGDFS